MGHTRRSRSDHPWGAITLALVVAAVAAGSVWAGSRWLDTLGQSVALTAAATGIIALATSHLAVIRPSRRRENTANKLVLETQRELREEKDDRSALRELDRALDQAEDERAALVVARHALARHFPDRPIEVLLVDAVEPVLRVVIALCRSAEVVGDRSSPWEPLATRSGSTLVYDSTDRVDACAHLRARAGLASSAIAVPLTAMGRILGVIYRFGPDGVPPDPAEVALLEDFASAIAARLALARTSEHASHAETLDRLTGLPDRASMQQKVVGLLADRTPFSVAILDIDDFGALNEQQGREVGDEALALLGQISRRAIRPVDLVGRVGGDELLFVFPETTTAGATRAVERIREELFVGQSATPGAPRFTLSIGIVGSSSGLTIDAILKTAAAALRSARNAGGNRIVVGEPVAEPT